MFSIDVLPNQVFASSCNFRNLCNCKQINLLVTVWVLRCYNAARVFSMHYKFCYTTRVEPLNCLNIFRLLAIVT